MTRRREALLTISLLACARLVAQQTTAPPNPAPALLLAAQGEYAGELSMAIDGTAAAAAEYGAQVVAYIDGDEQRLRLVLHAGGLPGSGWQRGDARIEVEAVAAAGQAGFAAGFTALLRNGVISFADAAGADAGKLQKVERRSPTLGNSPPRGAVTLFDGSSTDAFHHGRLTADANLAVGCDSKQRFADHRIHLEFRTPFEPGRRGQGRGNSGVYVQGRYECQILDSFGLEGRANECGGIYSLAAPRVNACLPPGSWQTYDIDFTAARFDGGQKVADARMTVHLNGILVHDDVRLPRGTGARKRSEGAEAAGLFLQDHGNPVEFRNIWVVERDRNRPRHVVFLAGRQSHGYGSHEHKAGCLLLAEALERSGLDVTTSVVDLWPQDEGELDRADAFVCYSDGGNGHPLLRHLDRLAEPLSRGAGLVCLHYAVEVPQGRPGQRFLDWIGGYFETHWSVNPMWTATFDRLPEHPITRGVSPFALHDEWYFHMRLRKGLEGVTPILSAVAPAATMQRQDGPHSGNPTVREEVARGVPQHTAWARVRPGGGRGFGFTGAHVHWNWAHDGFRTIVLNAITWAAHVEVPDGGVASATPDVKRLRRDLGEAPGDFDAADVERRIQGFGGGR
jgi:type 1 glutamine amidotransferase